MSTCSAADSTLFVSKAAAIQSCMETASPLNPYFPAGSVVIDCMTTEGISTGCSSCWGTIYDGYKSCIIDTCDWSLTTPSNATKPEGCCSCLSSLGSVASGTSICGIDTTTVDSEFGNDAATKLAEFASTCPASDNNGASVRSIATAALVFVAMMIV